jgi:hypothetical protein
MERAKIATCIYDLPRLNQHPGTSKEQYSSITLRLCRGWPNQIFISSTFSGELTARARRDTFAIFHSFGGVVAVFTRLCQSSGRDLSIGPRPWTGPQAPYRRNAGWGREPLRCSSRDETLSDPVATKRSRFCLEDPLLSRLPGERRPSPGDRPRVDARPSRRP